MPARTGKPRARRELAVQVPPDDVKTAWDSRLSGARWSVIAENMGYEPAVLASAVSAWRSEIRVTLNSALREQAREEEMERLDALQFAVWQDAMQGDPRAVETVLKVMAQRSKLLGLEETDTTAGQQVVVVDGSSEEYVAALHAIAGGSGDAS